MYFVMLYVYVFMHDMNFVALYVFPVFPSAGMKVVRNETEQEEGT